MRHRILNAAIAAMLLISCGAKGPDKGDFAAAAKSNNTFAWDLYEKLRTQEGNLFISPLSISMAMAMTYGGARGETADEMAKVMHFGVPQADLPDAFQTLADHLGESIGAGNKFSIANGLCLTGGDVSVDFKKMLADSYGAEILKGDLEIINAWVKEKTEGKIDEILKQLSPNSVCTLLNAIYFKGTWRTLFDRKHTRESDFMTEKGEKVRADMMYVKDKFRLLRERNHAVLEVPYKDGHLVMDILLPNKADGLPEVEKALGSGMFDRLDKAPRQSVQVYLPRFTIRTPMMELGPLFRSAGMRLAFDMNKADFSGVGWEKGRLCVSQVKHRAFVEVNEEGTDAAAATAVEMQTKSFVQTAGFRADHPFFFLIRDRKTGTILFMGRLMNP